MLRVKLIYLLITIFYKPEIVKTSPLMGTVNFVYKKFSNCTENPTPIKFTIIPKWLNETFQVVDADINTPVPIGDNLLAKIRAEIKVRGKTTHADLPEIAVCKGLNSYMGPIRHTMMSAIGLPQDACPVPKGIYHARNTYVDWRNTRIPACPYGTFIIQVTLTDKSSRALQLCLNIELENKPE